MLQQANSKKRRGNSKGMMHAGYKELKIKPTARMRKKDKRRRIREEEKHGEEAGEERGLDPK
jgi:hypothetical protein